MMHDNKEQRMPHGSGLVIGLIMGVAFWIGLILGVMM